jgi:hypothetical protein
MWHGKRSDKCVTPTHSRSRWHQPDLPNITMLKKDRRENYVGQERGVRPGKRDGGPTVQPSTPAHTPPDLLHVLPTEERLIPHKLLFFLPITLPTLYPHDLHLCGDESARDAGVRFLSGQNLSIRLDSTLPALCEVITTTVSAGVESTFDSLDRLIFPRLQRGRYRLSGGQPPVLISVQHQVSCSVSGPEKEGRISLEEWADFSSLEWTACRSASTVLELVLNSLWLSRSDEVLLGRRNNSCFFFLHPVIICSRRERTYKSGDHKSYCRFTMPERQNVVLLGEKRG